MSAMHEITLVTLKNLELATSNGPIGRGFVEPYGRLHNANHIFLSRFGGFFLMFNARSSASINVIISRQRHQ